MSQPSSNNNSKQIYCAIYTRKSTDENLNSEFTSLDSQREYCEAFVKSREPEGWRVYPEVYSDPGFSGGNMDRPGLKKLLSDVKQNKFNVVVCYKYDRLSRNTKDFLQVLETFDRYGVHFVSVTQPIDTTSSVGRLMRSILMDFAQFEREIIGERTRDKMAGIVRKGRRAGGWPVLGYDINPVTKHLSVNDPEAEAVKEIFHTYVAAQSLSVTAKAAKARGYILKKWITNESKKQRGGGDLNKANLQYMLRNPLYIGKIRYKGQLYPGAHQAILSEELFNKVGAVLAANCHSRLNCDAKKRPHNFILKGLIRCAQCGSMMSPTYNGKRIFHYKCLRIMKLDKTACLSRSVNAEAIEATVLDRMSHLAEKKDAIEGIVQRSKLHSNNELPLKRQERQGVEKQINKLETEIQRMVSAVADGSEGEGCLPLVRGIKSKETNKAQLQDKLIAIDREIQNLENQQVEADIIRNNLTRFGTVFKELDPQEQRRLMQLFLRQVTFNTATGKIQMDLRPLPSIEGVLDSYLNGSKVVKHGCPARTRT